MKKFRFASILTIFMMILFTGNLISADKVEVNKSFKAFEKVEIKVVSGDCVVKKGSDKQIKVNLVYTYPKDKYKPIFEKNGNILVLKEEFAKMTKHIKGKSHWTVVVPGNTKIDFKAASGDFQVTGLKSDIQVKVASGDVRLFDLQGKIEAKTASGDVILKNSTGKFTLGAASGDINVDNADGVFEVSTVSGDMNNSGLVIKGNSAFKAVSGNLTLGLAKSSAHNLELATVSGNILLSYNGNPVKGLFTFKGMKDDIHSDIPFDNKDEKSKYSPFAKKYFKKGDSPEVSIKTVSGKIEFKK